MPDPRHHKIDYIEIPTPDVAASRDFFNGLFGWDFVDYGPDYCSFDDGDTTGGFRQMNDPARIDNPSVLVVFYAEDLPASLEAVREHGGTITEDIFTFPGGRRFHFTDPAGVEFAIWSDDAL